MTGLKTYEESQDTNSELSFFLIYDKKRDLYMAGPGSLDKMNNAEVYRTVGSALSAIKSSKRIWTRHIEHYADYISGKTRPYWWDDKKLRAEVKREHKIGVPDFVAILYTVEVGTRPTFSEADLSVLKKQGE